MSYKRILLVDDDASIREALGHALRDENFQVVPAASGREALAKVNETPIDIALLDLNLGQHCGWDTFRRLNELQPRLPIVVMSALPNRFSHVLAASAAALLEKPLNMPHLFCALKELTYGGPAQRDGANTTTATEVRQ